MLPNAPALGDLAAVTRALLVALGLMSAGCLASGAARPAPPTSVAAVGHSSIAPQPIAPHALDRGAIVAEFARRHMGLPYCWGGTGPDCYDCSGFTSAAWRAAGVEIPRTSTDQAGGLPEVSMSDLQPGDVLWRPGHVGVYVGDGEVIASTKAGDVVRFQKLSGYKRAFRP